MVGFWRRGADTLHNGTILGILCSTFLIWGNKIYSWILINFPNNWFFAGEWTVPIVLLGLGAIVGYAIDRM